MDLWGGYGAPPLHMIQQLLVGDGGRLLSRPVGGKGPGQAAPRLAHLGLNLFREHPDEIRVVPHGGGTKEIHPLLPGHPGGCTEQIEGALGQGLGIALFEEMPLEGGAVRNPNLLDYKIPCALDVPPLVPLVVEEAHPEGPYGAKGVGEPGLAPTAAAIANAVYDAVGVQIKTLPFTPERTLRALRADSPPSRRRRNPPSPRPE